jgi:hypothetical protein
VAGFKNMSKTERRDYLRAYRKRKGKTCDCGNPATMMKWGEPVCARCNELENRRDVQETAREARGWVECAIHLPVQKHSD